MKQNELESQIEIVNNVPAKMARYKAEHLKLEEFIKSSDSTTGSEQLLLDFIAGHMNEGHIRLLEIPQPVYTSDEDISTQTNCFTISGPYNEVLNMIYDLERKNNFCKIISVLCRRVNDIQKHEKRLHTTVYVRSVI